MQQPTNETKTPSKPSSGVTKLRGVLRLWKAVQRAIFNYRIQRMARVKKSQPLLPLGYIKAYGLRPDTKAAMVFWQPDGSTAWYAAEYDGKDTYFGVVSVNGKTELRQFTRTEIDSARGILGLPAELDYWYTPQPLQDILAGTAW